MARPVHADADATRRRILESAASLFAERGVEGASVRDVAAAAGVSLAMVHHYFGSKEDLYGACVDAMYGELSAMQGELARRLTASAPLAELFAGAVVEAFRFACEHRTAVRLLVRAAVSRGEVHPRGRELLLRLLDLVSTAAGARLGRRPVTLRLPIQSIVFLVARYASQDEAELAAVAGVPARERRRALATAEAHLIDLTLSAFDLRHDTAVRRRTPKHRGHP